MLNSIPYIHIHTVYSQKYIYLSLIISLIFLLILLQRVWGSRLHFFLLSSSSIMLPNRPTSQFIIKSSFFHQMAAVSQSVATCSGLIHHQCRAKLPFGHKRTKIANHNAISVTCTRVIISSFWSLKIRRAGIRCNTVRWVGTTYAASVGKDHLPLSADDGVPQEPFLLSLFKETLWSLRSLFIFLLEQPSQLKYIEWPGFRSTLKTATLTLVLVALLIVALSSTDSALSYLLASILRRKP